MATLQLRPKKPPRVVQYFKKYPKHSNKLNVTFLDGEKKVFFDGKEITPLPLYDSAYLTYPITSITILQKEEVPPLPPPTPVEDVDPSVWLSYIPVVESSLNENSTGDPSVQLEERQHEYLRTDITLEELTSESKEEELPWKEKGIEWIQVKILDDELYSKIENKKIAEGKFSLVLEETDTIFLLEISSPQLEILNGPSDEEDSTTPTPTPRSRGKKKKEKKEFSNKATATHGTQTTLPLLIDAEVATHDPVMRDFSTFVTNSQISDGHIDDAQQDDRSAEKEIICQLQKMYAILMNPKGHFKNDLSYINFYLQVMAEELHKLKYDEQLKIIYQFIKDYEEDADIEVHAKDLDNDYDNFIKEIKRVRDELYPQEEPDEDEVEVEPITEVQNIEATPVPGYESAINEDLVQEIIQLGNIANSSKKYLTLEDDFQRITKHDRFLSAMMKIENIFTYQKEEDRIQKSMTIECIAEQPDIQSMYNLDLLWEFRDQAAKGKAVNCISWCKECPAIIAAGYGNRGYVNSLAPAEGGLLLVWSFALPKVQPLCRHETKSSVISICFHPESFYNLALGLSSGDVVIVELDKQVSSISSIVVMQETNSFGQAYALEWFLSKQDEPNNEDEPEDIQLIAGGRTGALFAWKSSYGFLVSDPVLTLPRMCEKVKGIQSNLPIHELPMSVSSKPAVMCIKLHPKCKEFEELDDNIGTNEKAEVDEVPNVFGYDLSHLYLVGTDDGAVHQCYFSKIHYHQDFFRAHNGPVYCLSFNSFVDRVFLTCGGDWAIRIWCLGVGEPLINLHHDLENVESAQWSVHYPTLIVSIRGNELCIWDLARRTSSPVSTFVNPKKHNFTSANFSIDGLNILTGDSEGNVCVYHLQDVPFISKFPVQHLVHAIKKSLVNKPTILMELEDTGAPFKQD